MVHLSWDVKSQILACGRAAFVAAEGYVMLTADYCQVELRMMAHLSADEGLCALLADPARDPFLQLASRWKRCPVAQVRGAQCERRGL